jgi:transposase
MKKVSKKEKPITFRMRSFLKPSQVSSFLKQCENLTLLQHYLRKCCIIRRFTNDKTIDEFKANFVKAYEKLNPLNWKILVDKFQEEQVVKTNIKLKSFTEQPIYKQLHAIINSFTDKEKEQYWLDYYSVYKKVIYRTTDLNYLYIKFKEDTPELNHCHSDIYQAFCQQFAIVFSNYEQGFTKLPKKAKNIITIGFKGTAFALFKHEMPKKVQTEYDKIVTTSTSISTVASCSVKKKKPKKLIYLNGLGLVEYVYHKEDFDLNKVSTVKLTMSKTCKFYLDFCYDLIQDPKIKEQYNKITNKNYHVDMEKDFVGYDWSMSQDNWLIGSKGFNIGFDKNCSMHSKKVIKAQKQLDNYKNQYKLFLIELFKINKGLLSSTSKNNFKEKTLKINNTNNDQTPEKNINYHIKLTQLDYPKIDKTKAQYEYIDLPLIEKTVKIEHVEQLEKELKTIQKYQELNKLFTQLISDYSSYSKVIKIKSINTTITTNANCLKTKIKELYIVHDKLVNRIKVKEKTLSTIWEKIGFKRKELVFKTAIEILNREEKYITFEELNTTSMMNNFSSNGENNYQFKPLRKKLGNSIYREIIERTILRAYRIGKVVLTINPKYTSMDCNNCSKRNLFLQLSDKVYQCSGCNNVEHRDLNAAKNIEYKGIKEVLYNIGLSSFNNPKLYNQKYKKVLKEIECNEKRVVNTDGQISMVIE